MAPLSWRHHTLLQALLSRGPLPERDFHALFTAISGGKNPATHRQLFSDTLLKINKELGYLQFELRACINQYDGTVYYGVVNNIADEESKLGSKYSVPQIAFYKGLLEAMVHEAGNDGSITNIDALNVRIENQVDNQETFFTSEFSPFALEEQPNQDVVLVKQCIEHWVQLEQLKKGEADRLTNELINEEKGTSSSAQMKKSKKKNQIEEEMHEKNTMRRLAKKAKKN